MNTMKVHPFPPILRMPSRSERVASSRVWVSSCLRARLRALAKMGSPTRLTTAWAPSTGATGSLACHLRVSTPDGKWWAEGWRTSAMTRSPEACSASTRWCPTMPLAPAIATVRDSSALGLVVIVSSFQIASGPWAARCRAAGIWHAQEADGAEDVGPQQATEPGDRRPPIVADDHRLLLAQRLHQPHDVPGELEDVVSLDRLRAV